RLGTRSGRKPCQLKAATSRVRRVAIESVNAIAWRIVVLPLPLSPNRAVSGRRAWGAESVGNSTARTPLKFLITTCLSFIGMPSARDALRPTRPVLGTDPSDDPDGTRRAVRPVRSDGPLTTRLVLINRPDVAVGVAQREFAPAPVLIGGLARDAQVGAFIDTVL